MPHIDAATLRMLSRTPALMTEWLSRWDFTRFVTLTFSQPGDGMNYAVGGTITFMRDRLKQMDARMNRKIIGRDYYNRPANRLFHFFAPEKIATNPHWYGVVSFYGANEEERARQEKLFDENLGPIWSRLVPAGTVDLKPINDRSGGIGYVAKALCLEVNFNHCVLPDEFLGR